MQLVYGLEAIGFNEEGFHSLELSYCFAESVLSIYSHFQKLKPSKRGPCMLTNSEAEPQYKEKTSSKEFDTVDA